MHKIWLDQYPPGIQSEIDMTECASINEMLRCACQKFSGRPAFKNLGSTMTYAQLDCLSRDFAAFLQNLPGLQKGARVALMMPNLLQYPVSLFGGLRAGMIVVNVNPLYTARELEHQLKDCGAEVIVILENFAHVLEKVLACTGIKHVVTTQIGDLMPAPRRWLVNFVVKHVKKMVPPSHLERAMRFGTALRLGARSGLQEARPGQRDIALLQYTGGTTGISKGAILTHGNLIANLLQASEWSRNILEEGKEIAVTALPLYHIFSLSMNCLLLTKLGGTNLLITNPQDMRGFIKELRHSRFSMIVGVDTLFSRLLNTPGFADVDFRHLRLALGGASAIHPAVAKRWLATTAIPLTEGYGLTEAVTYVSCNPWRSEYSGSVGVPAPSTEVSIRDDENRELPFGREGEICVRGPQVMQGYWNRPEETARAFTADGWLRTGDIGVMDDRGYVRITDRKKDMIIVSGFNVYPNEVEGVIGSMPEVLECGVIGVPDAKTGEAVNAFVVSSTPELSSEAVIAFCRQNLTSYKIPKAVEFRSELPKSPVGKVLRRELRSAAVSNQTNAKAAAA